MTQQQPEEEEQQARKPRSPMAWISGFGVVLGIVTGVLGLVFLLRPQLKPQGPPEHTAAHLKAVSFDRDVSFGQYLLRSNQLTGGLDRGTLARRGALMTFHFEIIGYKGKKLPLRWHLIEVDSGDQIGADDSVTIRGQAQTDEGDWPVWVQRPVKPGRYAIVVELVNPSGAVPLATLRSPVIRG